MPIRLVAFDLDGTLLTSAGTPAPQGAAALSRAAQAGLHVVPATTRASAFTRDLCRQLKLAAPMICLAGAEVWASPQGPLWASHTIPRQVALAIAREADRQGWELSTTVGELTYWRQRPGQPLGPLRPGIATVASNRDAIVGDPLRILASQPEAIAGLATLCESAFPKQCRVETYLNPDGTAHSLGILAPQARKGTALSLVCRRLSVTREQVLAIGDDLVDLALFARAGISVAMGNAPEEVKRQATAVGPSNDQEGVAWAVERYALGG